MLGQKFLQQGLISVVLLCSQRIQLGTEDRMAQDEAVCDMDQLTAVRHIEQRVQFIVPQHIHIRNCRRICGYVIIGRSRSTCMNLSWILYFGFELWSTQRRIWRKLVKAIDLGAVDDGD